MLPSPPSRFDDPSWRSAACYGPALQPLDTPAPSAGGPPPLHRRCHRVAAVDAGGKCKIQPFKPANNPRILHQSVTFTGTHTYFGPRPNREATREKRASSAALKTTTSEPETNRVFPILDQQKINTCVYAVGQPERVRAESARPPARRPRYRSRRMGLASSRRARSPGRTWRRKSLAPGGGATGRKTVCTCSFKKYKETTQRQKKMRASPPHASCYILLYVDNSGRCPSINANKHSADSSKIVGVSMTLDGRHA